MQCYSFIYLLEAEAVENRIGDDTEEELIGRHTLKRKKEHDGRENKYCIKKNKQKQLKQKQLSCDKTFDEKTIALRLKQKLYCDIT